MNAPKVGDRVHVEFDGEVRSADNANGNRFPVLDIFPDGLVASVYVTVPVGACTVIAPPIKVGDVVTADNIGQLPNRSIISFPDCVPLWRLYGQWHPASATDPIGATVLRIGGEQS